MPTLHTPNPSGNASAVTDLKSTYLFIGRLEMMTAKKFHDTPSNDGVKELKTVVVAESDGMEVRIPRINVLDFPTFEEYQVMTNDLREQAVKLPEENKEGNQFLNIDGNNIKQSLLGDVMQHLMKSPTFLYNGVISVWDDAATAYWNSLESHEREAVPVLFAILWAQGRIELFCTRQEKEAA